MCAVIGRPLRGGVGGNRSGCGPVRESPKAGRLPVRGACSTDTDSDFAQGVRCRCAPPQLCLLWQVGLLKCTFPSGSLVALVGGGLRNGVGSLKWSFAGGEGGEYGWVPTPKPMYPDAPTLNVEGIGDQRAHPIYHLFLTQIVVLCCRCRLLCLCVADVLFVARHAPSKGVGGLGKRAQTTPSPTYNPCSPFTSELTGSTGSCAE